MIFILDVCDVDDLDVSGKDSCNFLLLVLFCSFSELLEVLYLCGLFSVSMHLFG